MAQRVKASHPLAGQRRQPEKAATAQPHTPGAPADGLSAFLLQTARETPMNIMSSRELFMELKKFIDFPPRVTELRIELPFEGAAQLVLTTLVGRYDRASTLEEGVQHQFLTVEPITKRYKLVEIDELPEPAPQTLCKPLT